MEASNPGAAKEWWRPFALLVKATPTGKDADRNPWRILADKVRQDPPAGMPTPERVADALAAMAGRHSLRRTIPPMADDTLPRALWRQLQFAIGRNVNLGGLFACRYESDAATADLAEDLATVIALVTRGGSAGVERWQTAMGGR